jgi:hypothetical protein
MQQWRGWQLIKGGHVTAGQRFPQITFRLPQLWHWLGPSKLNYHSPHERFRAKRDDDEDKFLTAHMPVGLGLSLGPTFTKTFGGHRRVMDRVRRLRARGGPGGERGRARAR